MCALHHRTLPTGSWLALPLFTTARPGTSFSSVLFFNRGCSPGAGRTTQETDSLELIVVCPQPGSAIRIATPVGSKRNIIGKLSGRGFSAQSAPYDEPLRLGQYRQKGGYRAGRRTEHQRDDDGVTGG